MYKPKALRSNIKVSEWKNTICLDLNTDMLYIYTCILCFVIMLIFLSGPDTFRSRKQLKKMIEKFKTDRDPQGFNVVVLDCRVSEPSYILEQILTPPFLAEKKLVIL